jgi:hypothetical protein
MDEITRNLDKSQTISAPERSGRNAKLRRWSKRMRDHDRGVCVDRFAIENSAAERARWLAELAEALDEARHVVKELGAAEGEMVAVELYTRIEAVRFEVQAIRLRRSYGRDREFGPEWIEDLPWKRSA